MKNIIIGKRSYLSKNLKKKLKNSEIYTIQELKKKKFDKKKFNLIINSFYSSLRLNNISNYSEFYNKSIFELSNLIDIIPRKKINKIIYTSSSSVYSSINDNYFDDDRNRRIYSSTKLAAENLIKNYCTKNKIKFTIVRIFNLFGNGEKFSIISKIIESYKNKNKILKLINKGDSIRDFIHINDVTLIYKNLIKKKKNEILDIGRGYGIKISDIILNLNYKNFKIQNNKNNENNFSIAQPSSFKLNEKNSLVNYLKKQLKLKKKFVLKRFFQNQKNLIHDHIKGSIIYGAGEAGKELIKNYKKKGIDNVSFFVDDNLKKIKHKSIEGKKIISYKDLEELSKKKIINNIIIAIPSLSQANLNRLVNRLTPLAINISVVENDYFNQNKFLTLSDVNEKMISDIFKRRVNKKIKFSKHLNRKTILVTGAGGSIGSELVTQLLVTGSKVIALDHSELSLYNLKKKLEYNFDLKNLDILLGSINDNEFLIKINNLYKIDVIFHAAAYKHVNILENNVTLAVKNNIFGTLNLLKNFNDKKIEIIIISTDKAVKPINVLGATKRISELLSQSYQKNKNYFSKIKIVRFGNVFGSQGSAIELFINQLNTNQEITITDYDVKRYFMSIREACNLVISVTKMQLSGKIYILNMGKQILLKNIIYKLADLKKINKSDLRIKEVGLKKGEKLHEELSISKKFIKTKNKEIFIANEPNYNPKKIFQLLNNLKKLMYVENEVILKNLIFNFLSKEK